MAYYELRLSANKPYRQDQPGAFLLIDAVDGAASVDITLISRGVEQKKIPNRKAAFKYVAVFESVIFEASADCIVKVFLSFNEVSLGFTDGADVNVAGSVEVSNDPGNPVPVSIAGGTVTVTADNVGINNTDANPVPMTLKNNDAAAVPVRRQALTVLTHPAAVAVGVAATLLSSDATLRRLVIRNGSASANIAIGGAGVTLANGAIQLAPGDVWVEQDAAGASWYAISDTAATSVQVMGAK